MPTSGASLPGHRPDGDAGARIESDEEEMSDGKKFNQTSQDFAADLSALRDDISRLTNSVSDLLRARASDAADQGYSFFGKARDHAAGRAADARDELASRAYAARDKVVDRASDVRDRFTDHASDVRDRLSDHASAAQDRLGTFGSDVETKIERNPLTAVVVAAIAGLLMGLLSRSF